MVFPLIDPLIFRGHRGQISIVGISLPAFPTRSFVGDSGEGLASGLRRESERGQSEPPRAASGVTEVRTSAFPFPTPPPGPQFLLRPGDNAMCASLTRWEGVDEGWRCAPGTDG